MSMEDFNAAVIAEFRSNEGRVAQFGDATVVLLHTVGGRSGREYTTPVVTQPDGDRFVIFASKAGAPENPAWYHNLLAHPDVTIEVGTRTLEVTASVADGAERDRYYERQVEAMPQFGEYAAKTARTIPVVVLTPRG